MKIEVYNIWLFPVNMFVNCCEKSLTLAIFKSFEVWLMCLFSESGTERPSALWLCYSSCRNEQVSDTKFDRLWRLTLSTPQLPQNGSKHQCVPANPHLIIDFFELTCMFTLGKVKDCLMGVKIRIIGFCNLVFVFQKQILRIDFKKLKNGSNENYKNDKIHIIPKTK